MPGVPYEMTDMFERAILPDLVARQMAGRDDVGDHEPRPSHVGRERVGARRSRGVALRRIGRRRPRHDRVPRLGHRGHQGAPDRARRRRRRTRRRCSSTKSRSFGRSSKRSSATSSSASTTRRWRTSSRRNCSNARSRLAVAESVTGGLIASRLVGVAGASKWFRGGRRELRLRGEVRPSQRAGRSGREWRGGRSDGDRRAQLLKSDVGLSVTGVAGPEEQDGQPAGTVFVGLSIGESCNTRRCDCPGDRPRVRAYSAISALDVVASGARSPRRSSRVLA